jgi:hypothetical protein
MRPTTFKTDDKMDDQDKGQRNNVPVITQDKDKRPLTERMRRSPRYEFQLILQLRLLAKPLPISRKTSPGFMSNAAPLETIRRDWGGKVRLWPGCLQGGLSKEKARRSGPLSV